MYGGNSEYQVEENTWVHPSVGSGRCVEETPRATVEEDNWIQPIIVDDRCVEETPVSEVSTSDEKYNVEAMVDSGAGASVCSPTDFPTIAIDTPTAVTKSDSRSSNRSNGNTSQHAKKACASTKSRTLLHSLTDDRQSSTACQRTCDLQFRARRGAGNGEGRDKDESTDSTNRRRIMAPCSHTLSLQGLAAKTDTSNKTRESNKGNLATVVQLDYSFFTDGETQVAFLAGIDNVYHRTLAV
eukprot:6487699-Amphidinium_carterae.1